MDNTFKLLFVILCFIVRVKSEEIAEEEQCDRFHHYFRDECGWKGISKRLCLARGCCYDNNFKNSIWCFRRDSSLQDISSAVPSNDKTMYLKSCSRDAKKRRNCGWKGISKGVCEMRGCCYDKSIRNSYWCYKSDHMYLDALTSKVLQCTAKCGGMKWSAISETALKCKLNETCWTVRNHGSVVNCLQSCKIQESILEFIVNVSQCLLIDEEVAMETHDECDFQMSCWVQRHGHSAMQCYRRFNKNLHGINFGEMVENEIEKDVLNPYLMNPPAMEQNLEQHNKIVNAIMRRQPQMEATNLNEELSIQPIEPEM